MKKYLIILFFAFFAVSLNAQINLANPIPKNWGSLIGTTTDANVKSFLQNTKIVPRINIGVIGVSYELNSGKDPQPLSALLFGVSFLHYKNINDVPFNDWGIMPGILKNTQNKGYGIGIYGTYNLGIQNTVFNAGTHYDFYFKKEFIDTGLTFHY
jgi:hypothetical protein